VLAAFPSEHPVVVLSQIHSRELMLLVDFMYTGSIAVEQVKLSINLIMFYVINIKYVRQCTLTEGFN